MVLGIWVGKDFIYWIKYFHEFPDERTVRAFPGHIYQVTS